MLINNGISETRHNIVRQNNQSPGVSLAPVPGLIQHSQDTFENKMSPSHLFRTAFIRDRDRILLSDSFRKLAGKTQLFPPDYDVRIRNRLTHTIEVAQFARLLASALNLNEEVAEAISLGHDVGHTPFGHSGERAIAHIMNGCFKEVTDYLGGKSDPAAKGFKHNQQSIRMMVDLERRISKQRGLNLSNYTLFGIRHHTGYGWKDCDSELVYGNKCYLTGKPSQCDSEFKKSVSFYDRYNKLLGFDNEKPWAYPFIFDGDNDHYSDSIMLNRFRKVLNGKKAWSFEALLVALCDEIAQRQHDIEDALLSGIINDQEIANYLNELFQKPLESGIEVLNNPVDSLNLRDLGKQVGTHTFKTALCRFISNAYLFNIYSFSKEGLMRFQKDYAIKTPLDWADVYTYISETYSNDDDINFVIDKYFGFSPQFRAQDKKLEKYIQMRFISSSEVQRLNDHGEHIMKKLFLGYMENPLQLSNEYLFMLYEDCLQTQEAPAEYMNLLKQIKFPKSGYFVADVDDTLSDFRNEMAKFHNEQAFRQNLLRVTCDYIASMTDTQAINEYYRIYGTRPWIAQWNELPAIGEQRRMNL